MEARWLRTIRYAESLLSSTRFWWAVCLFWAAVGSWCYRYSMNADGMSYLDMASESLRTGPHNLVNGIWSPGYPALISLALLIFRPSPMLEVPVIHLVNFAVFGFVLLSFTFFLKSWLALHRDDSSMKKRSQIIPFCFGVFLWFTVEFIALKAATPDLCVAGIVFLAAGACCRISLPGANWKYAGALGGILGLGYYAKQPMFPLGLILLAILFVWPPFGNGGRLKVALAASVFLAVTAPLVALVSSRVGHLSIGESGRLNYAWHVNELDPYVFWTHRDGAASGTPEHPPRTILSQPTILEFGDPVTATYPLWYDPSYWYAGVKVRFDLAQQMTAVKANVDIYWRYFQQIPSLFAGAVVLCILVVRRGRLPSVDRESRWLLAWPIAACALFLMVHAEPRYLVGFFVLAWLALYRILWQKVTLVVRGAVLASVLCTLFVPVVPAWLAEGVRSVRGVIRADKPDYILVGDALKAAGVNPGDRLATVGPGSTAYYARYTGARIAAEIVDANEFRALSAEDLGRIGERLTGIGVKALVATGSPVHADPGVWKEVMVPDSPHFSIMLVTSTSAKK